MGHSMCRLNIVGKPLILLFCPAIVSKADVESRNYFRFDTILEKNQYQGTLLFKLISKQMYNWTSETNNEIGI